MIRHLVSAFLRLLNRGLDPRTKLVRVEIALGDAHERLHGPTILFANASFLADFVRACDGSDWSTWRDYLGALLEQLPIDPGISQRFNALPGDVRDRVAVTFYRTAYREVLGTSRTTKNAPSSPLL